MKIYVWAKPYVNFLYGETQSRGCARNYWITLDFVLCDPIVPGAATRRDQIHQIKLLKL